MKAGGASEAVGSGLGGEACRPVFLRLERGVSGFELESLGYKVTLLPRKARAAKAKAAPTKRRRRKSKAHKRALHKAQQKRHDLRLLEKHGIEWVRAKWREERRRQRARKKALVGGTDPRAPQVPNRLPPATEPASISSGAE